MSLKDIEMIREFCGDKKLYHSRADFIRRAVYDLLIDEFQKIQTEKTTELSDPIQKERIENKN